MASLRRRFALVLLAGVSGSAAAQKPRYYPWGCTAPARTEPRYANIADASFKSLVNGKGQIAGNTKHDWCYDDGYPTTAPVGSFPDGVSEFGVYDMAGNVGEWCLDADSSGGHANRGGTWGGGAMYDPSFENGEDTHFISSWLQVSDPGADDRTGFRVACTCDGVGTCQDAASGVSVAGVGLELIKIPGGTYTDGIDMAVSVPVPNYGSVIIAAEYWLGKYETTKGQFRQFVTAAGYVPDMSKGAQIQGDPCFVRTANSDQWGPDSSKTWDTAISGQDDTHPVSCVTWNDAKQFAQWLTDSNGAGWTCTLPTAVQWGYAARGAATPCSSNHPDNFNTIDTSENCPSSTAATSSGTIKLSVGIVPLAMSAVLGLAL